MSSSRIFLPIQYDSTERKSTNVTIFGKHIIFSSRNHHVNWYFTILHCYSMIKGATTHHVRQQAECVPYQCGQHKVHAIIINRKTFITAQNCRVLSIFYILQAQEQKQSIYKITATQSEVSAVLTHINNLNTHNI